MREEKQLLLDEIQEKLDQSKSFLLARYSKLGANTAHDFRGILEKAGAEFEVVRKRVFLKAVEKAGIPLGIETLQGHVGVVFAPQDVLEVTKAIFQFSKDSENAIEVLGGYYEGQLYSAQDVEKLSKLPSLNEMRAEFLGLLEAPMAQFLAVIEALLSSVMHAMDNKVKKEEQ